MSRTLTLHLGLPLTAVDSLQRFLSRSRDALAKRGAVYPLQFRGGSGLAHQILATSLNTNSGRPLLSEFYRYLEHNRDKDVIVSSEDFSKCLDGEGGDRLLRFITECGQTHRIRAVVSLDRMDRLIERSYLRAAALGKKVGSVRGFACMRAKGMAELFHQLGRLRRNPALDALLAVGHDGSPASNRRVIEKLGFEWLLSGNENWNMHERKSGLKEHAALLYLDQLSKRCAVVLSRASLIDAFESGHLSLPGEIKDFTILAPDQRRSVQESAIAWSEASGLHEYRQLYPVVDEHREFVRLSPKILDDADIDLIRRHYLSLRETRPVMPPVAGGESRPMVFQFWDCFIPSEVRPLMESWKQVEPEFHYARYDDEEAQALIRSEFGEEVLHAYKSCAVAAMKADVFRYCALLTHGGIYVDADTLYLGQLSDIYRDCERGVLVERDDRVRGRTILNSFMIVRSPHDPLIRETLDVALRNIARRAGNDVWRVTGPGILSAFYNSENPLDRERFEGFTVLPMTSIENRVLHLRHDLDYKRSIEHWAVAQKTRSIYA